MSKTKLYEDIFKEYINIGVTEGKIKQIIKEYNTYIIPLINRSHPQGITPSHIFSCNEHRVEMLNKGKRPPCHACKYVKRSMNILIDNMFIIKRDVMKEDRLAFLLRNSFYDALRTTRVNHIRLLASNIASMGNIMFSCAADNIFDFKTIDFICNTLDDSDGVIKQLHKKLIKKENANLSQISKIDSSLLYYLAAYRYYLIANLDKDASDCLLKIIIILNNVLTVILQNYQLDDKQTSNEIKLVIDKKSFGKLKRLFEILFTRHAKLVNRQGAYGEHSEVQSIRDILHMHKEEDINLTRSHLYSELIEAIWHIVDSEIKLLDVIKLKYPELNEVIVLEKDYNGKYIENEIKIIEARNALIIDAYNHFNYLGMPYNTFYSEVIFHFARYNINNYILKYILDNNNIQESNSTNNKSRKPLFGTIFLQKYRRFITSSENYYQYEVLFNINLSEKKAKQELVEFIIEDSIVCLSEILYKLTPFNHISSFSNNFVAGVYNSLWEYARMYETLGVLYDYKEYYDKPLSDYLLKYKKIPLIEELKNEIKKCKSLIHENTNLKDKYGSLRKRMFARLKHSIDDRTFKYTISQYAAEMALRYYSLIESSYSEGTSYRNQVSRNYLLNDDLDNDTWLFNTAIERFRVNTSNVEKRKNDLSRAIRNSRFYKYESYVRTVDRETEQFDIFDEIRFDDSLFTNTEL